MVPYAVVSDGGMTEILATTASSKDVSATQVLPMTSLAACPKLEKSLQHACATTCFAKRARTATASLGKAQAEQHKRAFEQPRANHDVGHGAVDGGGGPAVDGGRGICLGLCFVEGFDLDARSCVAEFKRHNRSARRRCGQCRRGL